MSEVTESGMFVYRSNWLTLIYVAVYAVRNSVLGSLILFFYFRRHFRAVDTVLAFTGILTGVVDSYAVWKEGSRKKAASRLGYSWFIGAWGLAGMTAAARRGRY